MIKTYVAALAGVAVLGMVSSADAAVSYSYTGTLPANDPNSSALFSFTVAPGEQDVQLVTYSYAGGVNAEGTVIAAGGFDVIVSLYDAGLKLLDFDDDGSSVVDGSTGVSYDSLINTTLDPGTYYAAVSVYSGFPLPNYVQGFDGGGSYTDVTGSARTSFYALDINVVPVPAALPLLAAGLGGLAYMARRKRA